MDEDFFKDYPVQDEAAAAEASAPTTGFDEGDNNTNGYDQTPLTAMPASEMAPPPEDAEPECEAVTAWRVSFARGLEEKMTHEREVKAERAERAKETLGSMYKGWEGRKKGNEDDNLQSEKEFLRERDGVISRMSKKGGSVSWDVVPELVDISGKFKEGARDTSRMRQVLMRMKSN